MADQAAQSLVSPIPNFRQLLTEDEPQSNREGQEEVDDERQQFTRTATSEFMPTIDDIEDQLSRASLDTTDLKNIDPRAAFPETDSKSMTESKSEYPFSSIGDSFTATATNHGFFDVFDVASNVWDRMTPIRLCYVDLRMKPRGLHTFSLRQIPYSPHQDLKVDVSAQFHCNSDDVLILRRAREPQVPLVILGGSEDDRHVLVNYKEREVLGCLVTGGDTSLTSGLSTCHRWLEDVLGSQHHAPQQVCLLRKGQRLDDPQALSHLVDFEEVDLVRTETVMLKFLHRVSQRCEKAFYVECDDTDYVREAKEKFLKVFALEEQTEGSAGAGGVDHVWLTCGGNVLPDDKLMGTIWDPEVGEERTFSLQSDRSGADLTATDAFRVHFRPPDSVVVKLNFKSDARKYVKSESVNIVSPGTDVQTLRHDISKVIHKDPYSFKMFIAGKKMEMDTALENFLRAPNCTVVVEQRPKIQLNVVSKDDGQPSVSDCFPVAMHRYERVEKLKQEVCSRLMVPGYCVDLHHKDVHLDERVDLRSSRLRSGDTVKALVRPNRIRVSVRLRTRDWEDVVVNDTNVATVGLLKAFARNVLAERLSQGRLRQHRHEGRDPLPSDPLGSSTFSVILGGLLLPDEATLREAGVEMNSRVVLVEEERLCFTVDPPGRVPVFLSRGRDDYQPATRVMAMCDGKHFYFTNPRNAPSELAQIYTTTTPVPFSGIDRCTSRLRALFPQRQPQKSHPTPAEGASGREPYICHLCRSASMPNFSSAPVHDSGVSRSQSQTFPSPSAQDLSQNSSHSRPRATADVSGEISQERCSTPLSSALLEAGRNNSNLALDVSDGLNDSPRGAATGRGVAEGYLSDTAVPTQERRQRAGLSAGAASGRPQTPPGTSRVTHGPGSVSSPPENAAKSGFDRWTPSARTANSGSCGQTPPASASPHLLTAPATTTSTGSYGPSPQPITTCTSPHLLTAPATATSTGSYGPSPQPITTCTSSHLLTAPASTDASSSFRHLEASATATNLDLQRWKAAGGAHGLPQTDSSTPLSTRARRASGSQLNNGANLPQGWKETCQWQSTVEGPDGNLVSRQQATFTQEISPEMQKHASRFGFNTLHGFSGPPYPAISNPAAQFALPSAGDCDLGGLPQRDTTYAYIKKSIVVMLARELGREGLSVMSELVPDRVISEAELQYNNDLRQRFLYCLRKWCQINGSRATLDQLKKVLENNDRNDLVYQVDRIDAREQGYETAP